MASESELDAGECLRRMIPNLPRAIGMRFESAFHHMDQAALIFDLDREMASFRAITAEEEAATALMLAIKSKRYAGADKFNPRNHHHKVAVEACVMAIAQRLAPILKTYRATFNFEKPRIDINIPLSNMNVRGGESFGLQLVEPLGLLHSREGIAEDAVFNDAIAKLAEGNDLAGARRFIAERANSRNTLLYASDTRLPESKATRESLSQRKDLTLILLALTVMVLQARTQQPMVKQAIPAFLRMISKAEADG